MSVTRWIFEAAGGSPYTFERNPDRRGGDTFWSYPQRSVELDVIGASTPTIQIDGFKGAVRTLRFTVITGTMMRKLETYYLAAEEITGCRDHLYSTTQQFNCIITEFAPLIHPTTGNFPGSGEDTYDLSITIVKTS